MNRKIANLAAILWCFAHAIIFLRAALPLPRPIGGKFPWGMFRAARAEHRKVVAEGRQFRGKWARIDLSRHFHYQRGATPLRVYEETRAFRKSGFTEERRAFAYWIADREQARGVELRAIRFRIELTNIDTKKIRYREMGAFDVTLRKRARGR